MIHYPWTRHFQRYEYIVEKGYVDKKVVLDAGCGSAYGSLCMAQKAKKIYALDLKYFADKFTDKIPYAILESPPLFHRNSVRICFLQQSIFNFTENIDVTVACEFIEHLNNPKDFVKHIAALTKQAFLTTPLADRTQKTSNPQHFREYSKKDFIDLLTPEFTVIDYKCQLPTLEIVNEAAFGGYSTDITHVVQMVWLKRN